MKHASRTITPQDAAALVTDGISATAIMEAAASGRVRLLPPPYAVRKALREATLAVGREHERGDR